MIIYVQSHTFHIFLCACVLRNVAMWLGLKMYNLFLALNGMKKYDTFILNSSFFFCASRKLDVKMPNHRDIVIAKIKFSSKYQRIHNKCKHQFCFTSLSFFHFFFSLYSFCQVTSCL